MSKENEDLAVQKIEELGELIPNLVSIPFNEKKRLPKLGKKSTDFVDRAFLYMKKNPGYIAPFSDLAKVEKDMEAYHQLQHILSVLGPVYEDINDTLTIAGSEAYKAALAFYHTVKNGSKSGHQRCNGIYKDLREQFAVRSNDEEQGSSNGTETEAGENIESDT